MVLYIIKTFLFFRRRDSLSQLRVERRWFELASKGDLVITLAARICNFWIPDLELITQVTTQTVPDGAAVIKMRH